jgi:dihydroorotase
MTNVLLQQVRVIDPVADTDRIADVLIIDGKIEAIEAILTQVPANTQVQDCAGLVLGPGLVDLYSHSGEPGFEDRETLDSLMQAAMAGGFTRVTLLPDTHPVVDHPAGVEWLRSQLQGRRQEESQNPSLCLPLSPSLSQWGALTLGVQGTQMVELMELAEAGVVGFADGQPIANGALLRRLLEYGQVLQKPIGLYCHDRDLAGNGVVREGVEAIRLGLPASPLMAETAPLAALLETVAYLETPVHLMRISTARGVALIRAAKAQGLPVTASTTWMHLLLDVTAVQSYDPSLRLDPPLGNPDDRTALIQGLADGTLDAIAIDHTPFTYEEKTVAFAEAPAGAIGLELALPLLWQTFVASGQWTAPALWRYLSTQPAWCLQQTPAQIAPGQPAELTLFDPQLSWKVSAQTLKSRSTNTPWLDQEIRGRVVKICRCGTN